MIRPFLISALFSLQFLFCTAQQNSTDGWYFPTHDTIRVLTVFVEIQYDTLAEKNDLPNGTDVWRPGELPVYADSIFDPVWNGKPQTLMTQYYQESSFGNLTVLGDYFPELIEVPYSILMKRGQIAIYSAVADALNSKDTLITKHGLGIDQFDLWMETPVGAQNQPRDTTDFDGLDHVMILTRNYDKLGTENGMSSGSSMAIVHGKRTNTFSMFSAGHKFPFSILHHEFNHMLIGGNNFHAGGGNSARFTSYFPFVQGGWGMMGNANSSLLTCSGWDRYWLGWKPKENQFQISARDKGGKEINGDISVEDGPSEYVLRDFENDGDAIRIKLSFIPGGEFQQWLWIENHTTKTMNGSPFDVFQFQKVDCVEGASPGLYMYVQIDANEREGTNIYGNVHADMRRPVLADGNFDFQWEPEKVHLKYCVNSADYYPYYLMPDFQNPLTGNHTQEFPQYFTNSDTLLTSYTARDPFTHKMGAVYERLPLFGNPRQAFRESGNNEIGIGTNPSTANMLSMVNARKPTRGNKQDNRVIYLNGINVVIEHTFPDGSIQLKVRYDDNEIKTTRRWCAPQIILSNHVPDRPDLIVSGKLILDIGQTMTRFDDPIKVEGDTYFTDPTHLEISQNAELMIDGTLEIDNRSTLTIKRGGAFTASKGSKIILKDGGSIHFENGSDFEGKGKLKIAKGSIVLCADDAVYELIRKRTCNKRRVEKI